MTQEVTITLETLHCLYESVSPSAPYLWAAVERSTRRRQSVKQLMSLSKCSMSTGFMPSRSCLLTAL